MSRTMIAVVLTALSLNFAAPAAFGQETLRAVSMFPSSLVYTRSFLKFIDIVNERGAGLIAIRFIGGPETMPAPGQADAAGAGVVDMVYGPGSYYPGVVPETDALIGSNISPMEQRRNGALALLDKVHRARINVHYLAHIDGGIPFHIYLREAPPTRADGGIDLTGLKLRAGPFYREFFNALGAIHVGMPASDVYTALERGGVDGIGWTSIGVMDFSWDKFLTVRIDPGFSQTDLSILINQDRWEALDAAARELLTAVAIDYEQQSYDELRALSEAEDTELRARGMRVITLGEAEGRAYQARAHESIWRRLETRDPTYYADLRALFYREGPNQTQHTQ